MGGISITVHVASSSRTRDIHLPLDLVNPVPLPVKPSRFTRLETHAINRGALKSEHRDRVQRGGGGSASDEFSQ